MLRTEKGGGAEVHTYAYALGPAANTLTTRHTNPLDRHTDYRFAYTSDFTFGRDDIRLIGVDGIASTTCPGDAQSLTYNGATNLTAKVDRNGRRHEFVYDALSRPTTIRDGAASPLLRTETRSWMPAIDRPTQIVRPRITLDYVRDAVGRATQVKQTDTTTHTQPYPTTGQTRI